MEKTWGLFTSSLETERETERQRQRERDRQIDRQRQRDRDKDKDRQTETERDYSTKREWENQRKTQYSGLHHILPLHCISNLFFVKLTLGYCSSCRHINIRRLIFASDLDLHYIRWPSVCHARCKQRALPGWCRGWCICVTKDVKAWEVWITNSDWHIRSCQSGSCFKLRQYTTAY